MHTMILCLGNERMPGDGIAARVGRILKALPLDSTMTVRIAHTLDGGGVDAIAECDQLIVVDAMVSGNEPGACFVEEVAPDITPMFSLYCRHRQVVKDIVDLTHLLAQEGSPKILVFIGVERGGTWEGDWEGDRVDPPSPDPSVHVVVDSVLRSFGAEVALRRMVAKACLRIEEEDFMERGWTGHYRGAA